MSKKVVQFYDWAQSCEKELASAGFKDGQRQEMTEDEIADAVAKLFATGASVMITHGPRFSFSASSDFDVEISVDSKMFRHR